MLSGCCERRRGSEEKERKRVRATSFLWSLGRRDLLKLAKCRLRIERKKFKAEAEKKKDEKH